MNRKQIKEAAKSKVKGNLWNIWWPALVIGVITSIFNNLFGPKISVNINNMEDLANYLETYKLQMSASQSVGLTIGMIISGLLMAGYMMYLLNYVRTGKFETDTIINTIKEKWVNIVVSIVLVYIIVGLCTALFVVPGIIMSLAYAMTTFLVIDTDVSGADALKKSRQMMKGYKWNYFVLLLSFIGWLMLVPFTLGLLLIWLIPYMSLTQVIYYDKLKKVTE